jgi:hypothetical protein
MTPGLFPAPDNAPDTVAEWDGLASLRDQHQQALDRYQRELDRLSREQRESPTQLNINDRYAAEAAARHEVEAEVIRLVWEARDLLDDWRSVEDATESERKTEIEQLRARLAELEVEDLMRRRLAVWLDRLEPPGTGRPTVGIYPWALMAEPPEAFERPSGPFAAAFRPQHTQPQPEEMT